MSWVRSRVLTGTRTAPIFITAKAASIHSGRLSIHRATLSPCATPSAISPRATRSTPAAISQKVERRPWKHSASRVPQRRAARSGLVPLVPFSNQSEERAATLVPRGSGARSRRQYKAKDEAIGGLRTGRLLREGGVVDAP